jgi:hypothetical protein
MPIAKLKRNRRLSSFESMRGRKPTVSKTSFGKDSSTSLALRKITKTLRARITRILKNDTGDISLDVLFRVLGALGQKVKIQFSKAA